MRVMLVALMALTLMAMTQSIDGVDKVQSVGGDFGRMWLENNLKAISSGPLPNATHNQTEANPFSEDWLGITSPLIARNNTTKNSSQDSAQQEITYSMSRIIRPVHQIDASWKNSLLLPGLAEPDKNGLINGVPAETYYSIGPAYFSL